MEFKEFGLMNAKELSKIDLLMKRMLCYLENILMKV